MTLDLKQVPQTPGIYKFFSDNKIIYIGKAINLKKRVSSYFGSSLKDRKTSQIKLLTDRIETLRGNCLSESLNVNLFFAFDRSTSLSFFSLQLHGARVCSYCVLRNQRVFAFVSPGGYR